MDALGQKPGKPVDYVVLRSEQVGCPLIPSAMNNHIL